MKKLTSIAGALVFGLTVSGTASAQSDKDALIERGKRDYMLYCSACHGKDARGQGPMAEILKTPVPDLTRIYRGTGEFPYRRVYKIIETGGQIIGHGGEMPVWGETFGAERAIKINELIHYIETVQSGH